jgi:uncharacterized oxidoreductase
MDLSNNTVLITGGTSGIGLAFAEEFLKAGSKVIVCGRRGNKLHEVREKRPDVVIRNCDVAVADERRELFNWVSKNYPDVNVLINNAGVQMLADMTTEVDLTRVHAEVETNLVAPIHLSSLFAPYFKSKSSAAIINISSGLAFVPIAFMPVYCATKAAIHSISLSLRHQLKETAVKVFEIAPPAVDTELGHDRREDKSQSHGGLPVDDFIAEAMQALRDDMFEAPIAGAKNSHAKREEVFDMMNQRFKPTAKVGLT